MKTQITFFRLPWRGLSWAIRLAPLLLAACSVLSGPYLAPEPTASPAPSATAWPVVASPTVQPAASATVAPATAAPAAETPAVAAQQAADVSLDADSVILHPGPDLYSGDQVSFEILAHAPPGVSLAGLPVTVYRDTQGGELIGTARYGYAGLGQRQEAILYWAWDTRDLGGPQTLVIAQDTSNPILAAFSSTGQGISSLSSYSAATGRISRRAKSRASSRICNCSSVREKSTGMSGPIYSPKEAVFGRP